MRIPVALLVDGSFFIKRVQSFKRKYFNSSPDLTPSQMVDCLKEVVWRHIDGGTSKGASLYYHYRTYFYDAPPLEIDRVHYPLTNDGEATPRMKHFTKDPEVMFRKAVLEELKKQKKLALRLGVVKADKEWRIKSTVVQQLIKKEREFSSLTNEDFYYSVRQKGVDIKLGIDIATLSLNKYVRKIVLIAGDSDFVPAAKLARTNGVDFVLDAMRNPIEPSLFEHIDGLVNFDIVAILKKVLQLEPDVEPTWWRPAANDPTAAAPARPRRPPRNRRSK